MTVFYWLNQGRLGNLLFQYAAILRYTSPDDRVYSFSNDAFELLQRASRFKVIPGASSVARHVSYRLDLVVRLAERRRLIGSLRTESELIAGTFAVESTTVRKIAGSLRSCFVVDGFFQDPASAEAPLQIKAALIASAKQRLAATTKAEIKVAVHIRLTDYGSWSIMGVAGTLIAPAWYRDRINELRVRLDSPTFIVFSDDIGMAKMLNLGEDVIYFRGDSSLEDFAAMALCDHAIISPSSFAWWAMAMCQNPKKIVMAPTYWLGFKTGTWYPPSIVTDWMEYYPVN